MRMSAAIRDAAGRLDPATAACVQVVWFDAGPAVRGRLTLLVHHLATIGVSWRVLLPGLIAAWRSRSLPR